jgi:hypothetical protein
MSDEELVPVSPRHSVRLEREYVAFVRRAPRQDFVVRTITRREANGMPLMSADIVIAGYDVRKEFPLAQAYPLHFRKTYYPGRLHGDPKEEFERQTEASAVSNVPAPIGYGSDFFRSCLLPGTPYSRLSPFNADPDETNLGRARKLSIATAAGLWNLLERAFESLECILASGLCHGDTELHNFIVCPSPLEIVMIDFEAAVRKDAVTAEAWDKRVRADFAPLLKEAVFLQCCLGPQSGKLADLARERLHELFKDPGRFRDEISNLAAPPA